MSFLWGDNDANHITSSSSETDSSSSSSSSSFLWRWWTVLWRSLGFSSGQKGRLLLLGLDNAGKTTLLYTLSQNNNNKNKSSSNSSSSNGQTNTSPSESVGHRAFPPTDRPALSVNSFTVPQTNIEFTAWDLGGHEAVRHMWQDYYINAGDDSISAVLFVVDASDVDRIEEAAYELDALIHDEQVLARNNDGDSSNSSTIPIAVLLNKCDLETALTTQQAADRMELTRLEAEHGGGGKLKAFRISVLHQEGYQVAFRWIASFMK